MKKIVLAGSLIAISLLVLSTYLHFTYPQTSVLKSVSYFMNSLIHPHAKLDKHVMGFLPYWRMDDMQYIRPEMLSEINYFGLTVGDGGQLLTVADGQTDPGWREWEKQYTKDFLTKARIMGTDISITIMSHNNEVTESLLDSPIAQTTLISQIIDLVKQNRLNGVNIDFEYLGEVDEAYKNKFTAFAKLLHEKIKKETPKAQLSLSIMPRAARDKDLFDFPKIAPYFDRFIGMSYDYYGSSSDIAGPGAPMRGFKDNKFFFDVETTYADYLKVLPKEKIVMGVPYYGWEFAVEDGKTIQSKTFPNDDERNYAAVMSYGRMRENKDFKQNQCQWDDYALSTWCWYTKDGVDHQVWLEDEKSLGIKYDFVNKQNLAGIAIWTLGFDKHYSDLWELLREKFVPRSGILLRGRR